MYINDKFKIGIFFTDNKWAEEKFKELIDEINYDDYKAQENYKILINGPVMIEFIKITPSARGYQFDRVYYQSTIQQNMVDQILKPILKIRNPMPLK